MRFKPLVKPSVSCVYGYSLLSEGWLENMAYVNRGDCATKVETIQG